MKTTSKSPAIHIVTGSLRHRGRGLLGVCVLGCLGIFLLGCRDAGPELHPVSGRVTYRGEPVPTGTVMFTPDTGPAATSTIGSDGRYALRAVAGRHAVAVIAQQRLPADFDPANLPADWKPPPSLVPAKYNRPSTSGLHVEVQPGESNHADLTLEN